MSKTLLIADDSMFQRFIQARVAKEAGFQVLEAKNGAECLEILKSQSIDLLMLDLTMPEKTGFEILDYIQVSQPELPVIVITADIQDGTKKILAEYQQVSLLPKPVDEVLLKETLEPFTA